MRDTRHEKPLQRPAWKNMLDVDPHSLELLLAALAFGSVNCR